jgi:predicted ferric reductase
MSLNLTVATHQVLATTTIHVISTRLETSWQWYIIRAAGFISAGLLILLMLSGIGQVTGITFRFIEPVKAWALHKAMAIALCFTIAIHVGFLLIDHFVPFSLVQILVPFASHYNNGTKLLGIPLGGLAISLGVLAMYLVAIVVASSLGWIESKKKTWRLLHYLNYVTVFFVFLHALYVGSDLKYGVFRKAWILLGVIVIVGVVVRLWRIGTLKIPEKLNKS